MISTLNNETVKFMGEFKSNQNSSYTNVVCLFQCVLQNIYKYLLAKTTVWL